MTDEQLAGRYEHKAYIGHSRRAGVVKRPSLKNAIKDAYEQAKVDKAPGEPQSYRVLDIWAVGTNPIHEYIVALGPE